MTALPNRGHFLDRLEQLVDGAESQGQSAAVLVLYLDRFKLVNVSLGHEAGYALLRAVARRLKELVRPADLGRASRRIASPSCMRASMAWMTWRPWRKA